MLQGVSAEQAAQGKNLAVTGFEDLGKNVEKSDKEQVQAAGVEWWKQQGNDKSEKRVELNRGVKAKVARASLLRPIPLKDAGNTSGGQDGQQPQTKLKANTLHYQSRYQRHEDDSHGQAIPDEASIIWGKVIIRGPHASQNEADKNKKIGPAFARIEKL